MTSGFISKTIVQLGKVHLAATSPIVWQFVSGTKPYSTVFTVHKAEWDRVLSKFTGALKPQILTIIDSSGLRTTIHGVYILHTVPSDSPNRVSFRVADRRWLWSYRLLTRDFNIPRKTGDRTALVDHVPIATRQTFDKYDYLPYSLNRGKIWTAKDALLHVLHVIESPDNVVVDGFPIKDETTPEAGQFTIQNVMLRDQGDVAIAKLLNNIPGCDIWIDQNSRVRVFDAADLDATEKYFKDLPPSTWDGDAASWVDRREVRPKAVRVHYQREVEVVFDFSDDYGLTSANPGPNTPFLENVLPTVDPGTVVLEYNPEEGLDEPRVVYPGTWCTVYRWLQAMNQDRPQGSLPWTFETIKRHWLKGDLDGVLGARGLDFDEQANIAARVQALKQHFRQTFRINRKFMERIRDIRAVRVGLLDVVTGARAPAAVWGEACVIPNVKGQRMASRKPDGNFGVFRNVDYLAPYDAGQKLIETSPGPARVEIVDRDLGIFRVEWIDSPYGDTDGYVPCHLVNAQNQRRVVTRDLSKQDDEPIGAGIQIAEGTNGIFLRETMRMKVVMTIVPSAPNNSRQFHFMDIEANRVASVFTNDYRIDKGAGPIQELFIPPGEATARFAWDKDIEAEQTLVTLLGLNEDDPNKAGVEDNEMKGFVLANEERHLTNHAISVAAEVLADYADNVEGVVVTRKPKKGLQIVGNIASASIRVAAAPSAKVDTVHVFPGQQRRLSRFAMMPDSARAIVLGIIPYNPEK